MSVLSIIGRNISCIRQRRELSQEDLSDLAGTSRPYISDIENGKVNIRVELLVRIAAALDCELSELITKKDYRRRG